MENIKNINLKDIKENIYTLKKISQQILINNIYYNFGFSDIFNCFKEKILTKYSYNFINNINLNNYICYKKYTCDEDIISYIFNIINFYIFCYDNEKENLYLEILNNNLIYISNNKKIHEENFYFKKEIFEDLFLKLNLKCKIIIKHLNTKDKIINYYLDGDKRIKYYTLNNGDIIYKNLNTKYDDGYHYKDKINYSFKEDYGNNNQISRSNDFYIFKYTETLIINCSNVEKLIDIDDNNEIKEEDNKKDITNDLLLKEIEDLKEKNKRLLEINIGLNDDIMDLEKQLKEYKEKFEKLSLFFKN